VESLLCRLLQETNGEIDAAQRGIVSIDEIGKLGLAARAASRLVEDGWFAGGHPEPGGVVGDERPSVPAIGSEAAGGGDGAIREIVGIASGRATGARRS
jgi:hypothetical protein